LPFIRRPPDFFDRLKQIEMIDAQRLGQLMQRYDRPTSAALLEVADVLLAESGAFGKLLLRQTLSEPEAPHVAPDQLPHVHVHAG
jgi:hypothetical protein